jgi:hypothetical protein
MNKHDIKNILKQLDTIPLPDKDRILSPCLEKKDSDNNSYTMTNNYKLNFKPAAIICITFILLISGFSTYAVVAEAKEYNKAVAFFNTYDLSTEGLSRGDIKRIYKDITTGKFTYGKTAEVIQENISGYEIFQNEPTSEDLKNLWEYKNSSGRYQVLNNNNTKDGVSYKYYSEEKYDEGLGFSIHDKSVFEKYKDDKIVWSVEFKDFYIDGYVASNDKVIVHGQTAIWSSSQSSYAYMAMIDSEGKVLWETKLQNGFKDEYIASVLPEGNSIAVFSRGDLKYLCLTKYAMDGSLISSYKNEVGNYGIWNAARLGDGYIVQLGNYTKDEHARIVKVGHDGTITDSFNYASEEEDYYITGIKEYNGSIYLSAYTVPSLKSDESNAGGRTDIARVLNYIFDNKKFDISSQELTRLVRDNFTAVLLVCEPSSGVPQEFFSVKGSLGGKLALSEKGTLLWDVESITDTYFSPETSSFTIGGVSYVYRYTFDEKGTILGQEKTNEVVNFRR